MLAESEGEADERRLVEWIGARGGEVTARQVQQGHRCYRTAAEAETALAELVEAGLGGWESIEASDKGGRPTRVFRLSTPSTVYETSANPEENDVS
jgi:hypothetical protein